MSNRMRVPKIEMPRTCLLGVFFIDTFDSVRPIAAVNELASTKKTLTRTRVVGHILLPVLAVLHYELLRLFLIIRK
jgi:hypothetical protein